MSFRGRATRLLAVATVAFWASLSTAQAPAPRGACAQIAAACRDAGFAKGAAATGAGLEVDCVRPIVEGSTARHAGKPLPQVDPQVVAACKASRAGTERKRLPDGDAPTDAAPAGSSVPVASPREGAAGAQPRRPNIVFVLTDDLSWNLVQYMPHVLKMQREGVTFSNYFVSDSLCCPSRSSIFTGRYPHNTGIFRNVGEDGGYLAFRRRGHEQATFATALSAAGYRTAMLGKYLNGYQPKSDPAAPGWSFWAVAGNGYPGFNYDLNEDGKIVHYGNAPDDYLTDVLGRLAVRFIKQSAGTPFIIEVATFAPHAPYTPAPRDANAHPGLRVPRTGAFNAAPDANAPQWLKAHPALSPADQDAIDRDFRKRAQSVLAVDAMIGELQRVVAAIGEERNTYFIFSSDNGYHMGEHRLLPGKMTAFDTDIRVPLVVTGPGVPATTRVDEVAENIDLCPTFAELGGMAPSTSIDGRSLVPLLHGEKVDGWRSLALIEHHGPVRDLVDPDFPSARSGNPTTYEAIRAPGWLYAEYANGEREYHDLATDADELRNTFGSLGPDARRALHAAVAAASTCRGEASCAAAAHADPPSAK
ncbi:MAG TPA: sulfatase [Casimicrobiaceae bacterium]